MPRFVLLFHDCPPSFGKPSHWDLMLERGGTLMTWSLEALPQLWRAPPQADSGEERIALTAKRLPDHRISYLDYEGPVSNDRGHVSRVDGGQYELISESHDCLEVRLSGNRAVGVVTLAIAQP